MKVVDKVPTMGRPLTTSITARQAVLIALVLSLVALTVFTRFWRLGTPNEFYFDEVFFPATAQEILNGASDAWEFIGHENTHPPPPRFGAYAVLPQKA